jgi:citrate lyase subunit beta/citryl-CoA lyase
VNALSTGLTYGDLDAAVCPDLDAVVLPKTESPEHLRLMDSELLRLEKLRGVEPGSILLLPLVETAVAIMRAYEIASEAPTRTPRLIFGLGDFSVDIGVSLTEAGDELLYAKSKVVVASRAARLAAPLDGPFTEIHDVEGLRANTLRSRALGFRGRVIVYPGQVETANTVYSQAPEAEIIRYRKIVQAFEEAEADGSASIQVDGTFVDYPIYRRAAEVLAEHDNRSGA